MSLHKYLRRSIFLVFAVALGVCCTMTITVSCILTYRNEQDILRKRLNVAEDQVRTAIQTSGHVLRDLANDNTLHYLYEKLVAARDTIFYSTCVKNMRNHLFYTILTQNTFKYLMLQDSEFAIIYSDSFSQSSTDQPYDGEFMNTNLTDIISFLTRNDRNRINVVSDEWIVSVYTDAGFTLSGLIDPDSVLGNALNDFVVFDDRQRVFYNGMSQWCTLEEMEEFLQSGSDVMTIDDRTWYMTSRSSGSIHIALFCEKESNALPLVGLLLFGGAFFVALLITYLQLRRMRHVLGQGLDALETIIRTEPATYSPETPTHQLQIQRSRQSIQSLLWKYLVRICIVPILLFVSIAAAICMFELQAQQSQYIKKMIQQQISVVNLHYQRCASFLRNSAFNYLLQENVYAFSDNDLSTFLPGYTSNLWSRFSERDSLLSVAIYDLSWQRIYMTGSADISVQDEVRQHFQSTYNDVLVRLDDGKIVYFIGIRNAGMTSNSISTVYQPYGYIAMAVTNPVAFYEQMFSGSNSTVWLLSPDETARTENGSHPGQVFVRSRLEALNCDIEICASYSEDFIAYIAMASALFVVMLLGLVCMLLICTHIVAQRILIALIRLQNNLEVIYQSQENAVQMTGIEEFDFIYECFFALANALKEKQDVINCKQIELLREQRIRTDLQLASIESQLSPHFLFNIFTSIRFLLEENNIADATKMLKLTVRMFRSFLYRGHALTTLRSEIEHASSYIEVQRFRYDGQLDMQIDPFCKNALDALVPQYTLQPLVENAIEHALVNCLHLNIRISGELENGILQISISDNGGRMDDAGIAAILHLLEHDDPHVHCGLSNIHKRLQLHFGQQYGLRFFINDARGLTVLICIPAKYDMDDGKDEGMGRITAR